MTSVRETGLLPTLLDGSADPQAKQGNATGGVRGERTGEAEGSGYKRSSASGLRIEEASGVAYAEATRVPRGPFPDVRSGDGWLLRWLIVGGAIGFAISLMLRPTARAQPSSIKERSVRRGGKDAGNLSMTR